jgi:DNA-binding transcriptional LysR family regulator
MAGRIADGRQRILRVGVVPQAYVTYLPKAIDGFRAAGGCAVEAVEGTSQQLLTQLLEGNLDCVIGRLPSGGQSEKGSLSSLAYVDLYDEEICIAVGADHDDARLVALTHQELASREWVLQRRDSSVRRSLNEAFLRHAVAVPEPVLETANYMQSLAVIQVTPYFTVAPRQAVETQQRLGLVKVVNFALEIAPMQVSFINRMTSEGDPTITLFKEVVARVVNSDPSTRPGAAAIAVD